MISNCGHDENGKYTGGKAGDQTGGEYAVINWYNRPWACVLRYPDINTGLKIAEISKDAALNNNIGYDQGERLTYYNCLKEVSWEPAKITTACEGDCSSTTSANIIAAGYLLGINKLKSVNPSNTTSTLRKALVAVGFELLTDSKYLTSDKYLLPGDIPLYDGHHVAVNLDYGEEVTQDKIKKSGWVKSIDGWLYYNGDTGKPVRNDWLQDGEKWYWFNAAGIMVINTWYQYNNAWYYLGPDGSMCKSQLIASSEKIYAVDSDGKMVTGEILVSALSDGALEYKGLAE